MIRWLATALHGAHVVITRPVGYGGALARRVRALGGQPLLLPGLALRPIAGKAFAGTALDQALQYQVLIFTSPAAVRFAARLQRLRTSAAVMALGAGTARALKQAGISQVLVAPAQACSEGLLQHPRLAQVTGQRVAVIGAAGGRGVLAASLRRRGAQVHEVHVYRRVPARLTRRHADAVSALPATRYVLLSSVETLRQLQCSLDTQVWAYLCASTAVVSSQRLHQAARAAGFQCVRAAASALGSDLLRAVVELYASR